MPEFIDPNKVLSQINLTPSMIAADLGSGGGGWTMPIAKILDKGKVFAVDVQEEVLSALKGKANLEELDNIKTILADLESGVSDIGNYYCDLVVIADVLFQSENPRAIIEEGKRILKPEGRMIIVEWNDVAPMIEQNLKIPKEKIKEMANEIGLEMDKEVLSGDYHYTYIFKKQL